MLYSSVINSNKIITVNKKDKYNTHARTHARAHTHTRARAHTHPRTYTYTHMTSTQTQTYTIAHTDAYHTEATASPTLCSPPPPLLRKAWCSLITLMTLLSRVAPCQSNPTSTELFSSSVHAEMNPWWPPNMPFWHYTHVFSRSIVHIIICPRDEQEKKKRKEKS